MKFSIHLLVIIGSITNTVAFQHRPSFRHEQPSFSNQSIRQSREVSHHSMSRKYDSNINEHEQTIQNNAELNAKTNTRRSFLSTAIATSSLLMLPTFANAAKGAAEYDLEFYLRDLIQGNSNPGGNISVSSAPSKPPARTLQSPLLQLLLDDFTLDDAGNANNDIQYGSIPALLLADILTKSPTPDISSLSQIVNKYRSASKRGFASKAQWKAESVTDQYYFDVTAYALWRSAAKIIPNFAARDLFVKQVGRQIYQTGKTRQLFTKPTELSSVDKNNSHQPKSSNNNKDKPVTFSGPLTQTIPALTEIMNVFTNSNFCANYRLGGTNNELDKIGGLIFDTLDDDDIVSNGYSIDCLISVYEPSTLNAALQITAEGSRFSPDYIGPTLVAMWEEYGIKATYETYFVDQEYRPNPKDFFPNEQLYQFSLSLMPQK